MLFLTGSYAETTEPGIRLFKLDPANGQARLLKTVTGIANPSYVSLSGDCTRVYAISEMKEGTTGHISIYVISGDDIEFQLVDQLNYEGAGSCFISTDHQESHAFIANYDAGSLTVIRLSFDGQPLSVAQTIPFAGRGIDPERQEQPHIHCAQLHDHVLYCTDLGTDRLYRYDYNPSAPEPLRPSEPPFIQFPAGSGPRHIAFPTEGDYFFVLSELSGELFVIATHKQEYIQQTNPHAEDYTGKKEPADIQVHPNGRFLYASLRGDANQVVCYQIDPTDGKLGLLQRVGVDGDSPRSIAVSKDGKILLTANEKSDSLSVFSITESGELSLLNTQTAINTPACVKIIST